jgi:hypothetical protein
MTQETTRLAFWGRVSTEDNQDIESSRGWQLTRVRALIEPRGGQIVAEYFDIDKSRSIPPARRPQAVALLAVLADPSRGFEAVVVGSRSERSTATSSATPSLSSPTMACLSGCPRSAARSTRTTRPTT